jgi:hypothetical protein
MGKRRHNGMGKRRHKLGEVLVIDVGGVMQVDPDAVAAIDEDIDNLYRNIQNENLRPGIEATKIRHHVESGVALTTDEAAVPHNLGVVPLEWAAVGNAAQIIYESKDSDSSFVYLKADGNVTARVIIKA